MRVASSLLVWLSCLGALQACIGSIGTPEGESGSANTGGSSANMLPPGGGSSVPSPDTGLWRLTRTEYNNTIHDLLGNSTQAGNALDPDALLNGFDNNAEVMKLSVVSLDKYDSVANDVVEAAFLAKSSSRKKLLGTCDPITTTCARTVLGDFTRRAWRRPVAKEELDGLMTTLDDARAEGETVEEGLKLAFRTVLVSPNFIYRVEVDPTLPPGAKGLHRVGPYELATRLSYFIWSSTPDDKLLAAAEATGDANLTQPKVFAAELGRMLADPKADALVNNFGAQWMNTRVIDSVLPDPVKLHFQDFETLRPAMKSESQSFFRAFLKEDRNIVDMLDANFTFANERLAKHYGLPNVTGTNMRQVPTGAATHRFGLLSQAGFLTLTSLPDRTVPTTRGKWVLARLLCQTPPPKPANVPALEDALEGAPLPANATIRDKMEVVDKNPCTGACHPFMDPIGFALEHYDAIGRWRDVYPNNTINAKGEFGSQPFDGAHELSKRIKEDPRFVTCFTKTLFGYALGRVPRAEGDDAAVDSLATDFAKKGGRIRDLITQLATSNAFQFRGGQP